MRMLGNCDRTARKPLRRWMVGSAASGAAQFHNAAGAPRRLREPGRGEAALQIVIGGDARDKQIRIGVDSPISNEHRNFCGLGKLECFGPAGHHHWGDHDRVDMTRR